MRWLLPLFTVAAMVCAGMIADRAAAAGTMAGSPASHIQSQQGPEATDDDRVEVQLVVLGVAVGFVVVFGTLAYLARRRLGLVAPPPDPGEGGHDAH